MRRVAVIPLLVAVSLLTNKCISSPSPQPRQLTDSEAGVLATALNLYASNPYNNGITYVVETPSSAFDGVGSQVIAAVPASSLPRGIRLVPRATVDRLLKHGNWTAFWEQYPSHLLRVSVPEFANDGTATLVIYSLAGSECCGAEQLRFRRIEREWQLESRRLLWVH
jgi:hypothetical protein